MELRIFGWVSLNHETRHGSPKSQSFLENIPFVYGGKNQGLLIVHLMLCSRPHLHRHIFGLKYTASQDFNIL